MMSGRLAPISLAISTRRTISCPRTIWSRTLTGFHSPPISNWSGATW
jgi:hypothetical protein